MLAISKVSFLIFNGKIINKKIYFFLASFYMKNHLQSNESTN